MLDLQLLLVGKWLCECMLHSKQAYMHGRCGKHTCMAAAQVALTAENRDLVTRLTSTHQKLKLLKAQRAQLEARVQQRDAQVRQPAAVIAAACALFSCAIPHKHSVT
jgi:hypothetical protein